jgi:mannose-6-phosphate isomerase-like protein (cupin superfamily)
MNKVNLSEKLALFNSYWDPKIVGELNGQCVKLVKFHGEFVWHEHEKEDELFLVIQGQFDMQFKDSTINVKEGEFIIVPRGIKHCPKAEMEVAVLLFEPSSTVNTGAEVSERTRDHLEKI